MTELQTGSRQADAAATYKIASIPADGVGKEVIAAGRKVLDFVAEQSERQVRLPVGRLRLGQRVLRPDRPDDGRGRPGDPEGLRRDLLRRGRLGATSRTTSACGACG